MTLVTKGWIAAVVLVVFVREDQLESHLLQPLVVGRMVRLHPLAIILVLAVGGIVAGIPGAVVAVPTAAAINRAPPPRGGAGPRRRSGGGSPAGGRARPMTSLAARHRSPHHRARLS